MIRFVLIFLIVCSSVYPIDKFVVITPERTGTHLLTRALTFLTDKPVFNVWERYKREENVHAILDKVEAEGKYLQMHAFYQEPMISVFRERGYKVIFLLRDPRDHLISVLNYILERHWEYESLRMDYPFGQLSTEEKITEMITGEKYGISVPKAFLRDRMGWMNEGYTTYYEKLVGIRGGGSRFDQVTELSRISEYLGIPLDYNKFMWIADNLYGWDGLGTFYKGKIGTWKECFTYEHIKLFNEKYQDLLNQFGYE